MGAMLMKMVAFLKQNAFCIDVKSMGAMLMKMPILKKNKLVCRDAIFWGLYVAHDFAWGRC